MLYQIGPLTCDTFPFEVGSADRETTADFAKAALLNRRKAKSFSGPGDGTLDLSGQLMPYHVGGLSELDLAHQLCESGQPLFVTRGDGRVFGWHVLLKVKERHKEIGPAGVGFVVVYELSLERDDDPGPGVGADAIDTILSLFG